MKHTLSILLLFPFFLSCEKSIEIEMPIHTSKAVVNCLFTQDSIFKIHLSKSAGIQQTNVPLIKNASIKLYKDDKYIETLKFKDSIYQSEAVVNNDIRYSIMAEFSDLEGVTAVNFAPKKPILNKWIYNGVVHVGSYGTRQEELNIEIQDDNTINNYYEVLVEKEYTTGEEYGNIHYKYIDFVALLNNEDFMENQIKYDCIIFNSDDTPLDYSLTLILRHVSKDYYIFKQNLFKHQEAEYVDVWDDITEPFQMTTNIKGGFGVFAGYSEIREKIQ